MASSTRGSETPRPRICDSTMPRRNGSYTEAGISENVFMANRISNQRLFLASTHAHVKADYAVLVARAHGRNIAVKEILALDDLLRALRNVGAVSEGKIIATLLLTRNLRS